MYTLHFPSTFTRNRSPEKSNDVLFSTINVFLWNKMFFSSTRPRCEGYVSCFRHTRYSYPAQVDAVNQSADRGQHIYARAHTHTHALVTGSSKFSGRNQCGDSVSLLTPLLTTTPLSFSSLISTRVRPLASRRYVEGVARPATL